MIGCAQAFKARSFVYTVGTSVGNPFYACLSLNAMYRLTITPVRTDVMVRKFLEIIYDARACNQLVTRVTLSKPHRSVAVRKTHICVMHRSKAQKCNGSENSYLREANMSFPNRYTSVRF